MPIMEISIIPVGGETPSFSQAVKEACQVAQNQGLKYQVNAMSTVVEGNLDQLMSVASNIHRASLQNGNNRVITHITIDERQDQEMDMETQAAKANGDLS
jgi:uncharacterized protein (TIGR00106 family)